MKTKNNKGLFWIIILLALVFVVDAYYQLSETPIPVWQTEWFMWRVIAVLIIIAAMLSYKIYASNQKRKKEFDDYKVQLLEKRDSDWKLIAGELHDSIGQNLSAANIYLLQNTNSLPDNLPQKEKLKDVSRLIVETLEEVRRISSKLYPGQVEKLGLTTAINSLINRTAEFSSINFRQKIDNINDIFQKENEVSFYRILQELINNIVKHSGATEALIDITRTIAFLSVRIEDNGTGFDMKKFISSESSRFGYGLINIEERIKMLGADMNINSEPGKGTVIEIKIPILKRKSGSKI
jgi:signal transduction histidine kinase